MDRIRIQKPKYRRPRERVDDATVPLAIAKSGGRSDLTSLLGEVEELLALLDELVAANDTPTTRGR